jgi:hypothetical protein
MMPTEEDDIKLIQSISNPDVRSVIPPPVYSSIDSYLRKYLGVFPTLNEVNSLKTSKLNQTSRTLLAQDLGRLMLDFKMLTKEDVKDIREGIVDYFDENREEELAEFIQGKLGGADVKSLKQFANVWKTTIATAGGENLPPIEEIDLIDTDFGALSGQELSKEAIKLKSYKEQFENTTFKERKGQMYQKGYVPVDLETSTIASSVGDRVWDLADLAGSQYAVSLAEDINSVLKERPNIGLRLQQLEMNRLNSAGYRSVNDIRDSDEAESLLRELHSELESDLEDNVGMTISEIEDDEYDNVVEQQVQLSSEGAETSDVGDILNEMVSEVEDRDVADQREIEKQKSIAKERIKTMVKKLPANAGGLGVNAIYTQIFKQALQNAYLIGDINYSTTIALEGIEERSKTTTLNSRDRLRGLLDSIVDAIAKGYKDYSAIDKNEYPYYKANDKKILEDFDESFYGGEGRKQFQGFGVKKLKKGTHKMPDGKIMKDEKMGSGVKGRISVKKLVGRGIAVENQPTYKQFGKYVMHYPHLVNNNVLNVKYPSLGSIPAIKPKTITDEYKDFVLDIFDTGKMNERLFNTLDNDEKAHFHKVCKGAGLLELFKLKKGDTGEEKEDLDRFNLLRGSFIAGNNGESVIRELRGLITKFIHEGRITKNEGLSLLMEIK